MSVNRSRSSHSQYNNAIFGTPTEPLFNNEENGICPEILQDWLDNMALMNARDIETATVTQNIFSHGSWSECVFLMCDRFELPCQAKYAALEIFDRFMLKHLQDLYSHVQNTKSVRKKSDWECILERVKNQAFLRILSCCQIASKLNSHYKQNLPNWTCLGIENHFELSLMRMYLKLKIGTSEICPCGVSPENADHVLQHCSLYQEACIKH